MTSNTMTKQDEDRVIQRPKVSVELRNVWKIFGPSAQELVEEIRLSEVSKEDIQKRTGCIVGVRNASFSVFEGEIFCIMGLSGSGKSTLVRLLNRLHDATSGEVLINGEDVMQMNDSQLRHLRAEKIGMVFQHISLLPHRSIQDNVTLPLEVRGKSRVERRRIAARMLELVGLDGWQNRKVHELSGGMQQRVGLARALAADPDILLMDEPFGALDPLIRRQLQDEFIALSERTQKTTIFITHDLDEAIRIGHRIAIMKNGKIVQIGTAEEIVTQPTDDYVADFVAGISRLKLVRARTIMGPLPTDLPSDIDQWPQAELDCDLDYLTNLAVQTNNPIVIQDESRRAVGLIDHSTLLRGIQGGQSNE